MICNTYVQFFKTLAKPAKLAILKKLQEKSMSVSELCKELKFEQSRVSHNLKKLKDLGFVQVKQMGKKRVYSLDKKTIVPLLNLIQKHVDTYYHVYCKCKGVKKKERWKSENRLL